VLVGAMGETIWLWVQQAEFFRTGMFKSKRWLRNTLVMMAELDALLGTLHS